jgi:hypothetical protein
MTTPAKFTDLDYTPTHGCFSARGSRETWSCDVSVQQGRAMEADGIEVTWVAASIPAWIATAGLSTPYYALYRLWAWPGRALRRKH